MGKVITESDKFKLVRPYHSWDMNYHLFNKDTGVEMLIDIDDVYDDEDIKEFGIVDLHGIHWEELKEFDTHGELPFVIWKAFDMDGNDITSGDLEENYKLLE